MNSLERYEKNLPKVLICSDNKMIPAKSERWFSKQDAIDKRYVVANHPNRIFYIIFDIDSDGLFLWETLGVQCPTLIVYDVLTHRCHYIYELYNPLPARNLWSDKTVKLVKEVCEYYSDIFKSHKVITNQMQLSKNALFTQWGLMSAGDNCGVYSLSELAEPIKPIPQKRELITDTTDKDSRNCYLFDTCRLYAYSVVKDCGTEAELFGLVYADLVHLNETAVRSQFPDKGVLGLSTINSTAKSISGWTWLNRSNFQLVRKAGVNYGAMGLPPMGKGWTKKDSTIEVKNRQKLSAEYCHRIQKEKTQHAIWLGIQYCRNSGIEVTQKNVSEQSGVSLRGVKEYWYQIFAGKTL